MTIYYIDVANFFFPTEKFPHYEKTIKKVIKFIHFSKKGYILKTTKRAMDEYRRFSETVRLFFEVIELEDSEKFRRFCNETQFAVSDNKYDEPADASIAYAAIQEGTPLFIVSNDQGFSRMKRAKSQLMKQIEIIEPTKFLKDILYQIQEQKFEENLKYLIVRYAEHYIENLMDSDRSIERVVESLLYLGSKPTVTTKETTHSSGESREKTQIEERKSFTVEHQEVLEDYINGNSLSRKKLKYIQPITKILIPFRNYFERSKEKNKDYQTRLLYIQFPDLLNALRAETKEILEKPQSERKEEKNFILIHHSREIETFLIEKLFRIRIEETLRFLKDCYFEDAFFHFRALIESDWNFEMSLEMKSILKLLYGIFLLNIKDFGFFSYLVGQNFWTGIPSLKHLFENFLSIKDKNQLKAPKDLEEKDLKLIYNLGCYYCNTQNDFGLQVFDALFQVEQELLDNLSWCEDFLKRYILELHIHNEPITDEMEKTFLAFLNPRALEENTNKPFDRTNSLKKFTPIKDTAYFFRQEFYLIKFEETPQEYKTYCWNDIIKSIVLIQIPLSLGEHLENVRAFKITKGKIKTKNVSFAERGKARIKIILDEQCELDYERFKVEIKTSITQK